MTETRFLGMSKIRIPRHITIFPLEVRTYSEFTLHLSAERYTRCGQRLPIVNSSVPGALRLQCTHVKNDEACVHIN